MNKILKLFDQQFVADLFNEQVLPLYPNFKEIKRIEISPIKRKIWETTYHVVIEFATLFADSRGRLTKLPIYCSAHSGEPRKKSFAALSFLWQSGFNQGNLTLPRPLFFSDHFNGYFYRGVEGHNLYYYIREKNRGQIESILPKTAAWFHKLHSLPADRAENFNKLNSRVKTVIPGFKLIFSKIKESYPDYFKAYKEAFEYIDRKEKSFLADKNNLRLIHGDAHPENVIKMSEKTIAVIDFTDICLADSARDLGAFLQQLEFMSFKKIGDEDYIKKIKKLFLESYLNLAGIGLDRSLQERIDYYYGWTALRTASLFLLQENAEPERAHELLAKVRRDLKIN